MKSYGHRERLIVLIQIKVLSDTVKVSIVGQRVYLISVSAFIMYWLIALGHRKGFIIT